MHVKSKFIRTASKWATLQGGVNNAFESLRTSVKEAYDKVKKA